MRPTNHIIEINSINFAQEVENATLPILVDSSAAWCAPCRAIEPHLEAIAGEQVGRLRVGKVDVETNDALADRFDVRSLPLLLLFTGGEVVGRVVGMIPRARLEDFLRSALGRVGKCRPPRTPRGRRQRGPRGAGRAHDLKKLL